MARLIVCGLLAALLPSGAVGAAAPMDNAAGKTSGLTPALAALLPAEDVEAVLIERLLPAKRYGSPLGVPDKRPGDPGVLFETGIASTYGTDDGFQGELTACGQVFDTFIVQVAHKTLPCGTLLRVEDAETGKSVLAEVTDRGPYIAGRVVDLSWAAFKVLDPEGPGLRPVKVYVLK